MSSDKSKVVFSIVGKSPYDDLSVEIAKCPRSRRTYVFVCSQNGTDVRLSPTQALKLARALKDAGQEVVASR